MHLNILESNLVSFCFFICINISIFLLCYCKTFRKTRYSLEIDCSTRWTNIFSSFIYFYIRCMRVRRNILKIEFGRTHQVNIMSYHYNQKSPFIFFVNFMLVNFLYINISNIIALKHYFIDNFILKMVPFIIFFFVIHSSEIIIDHQLMRYCSN